MDIIVGGTAAPRRGSPDACLPSRYWVNMLNTRVPSFPRRFACPEVSYSITLRDLIHHLDEPLLSAEFAQHTQWLPRRRTSPVFMRKSSQRILRRQTNHRARFFKPKLLRFFLRKWKNFSKSPGRRSAWGDAVFSGLRNGGPACLTSKLSICWKGTHLGTHAHRGATVSPNFW